MNSHRHRRFARIARDKLKKSRLASQNESRVVRVEADLKILDGVALTDLTSSARLLINDFSSDGIKLFSESPFYPGQRIGVNIQRPGPIFIQAEVIACQTLSNPFRILSETPFPYRITLLFHFDSGLERYAVNNYCKELHQAFLSRLRAA